MKIYGSLLCPDCIACKEAFDQCGITYDFIDILNSLSNLKEFLALRDNDSLFEDVKKGNSIGIPCCIEGDDMFLDWAGYLKEHGYSYKEKAPVMCSLEHKNC